MNKIKVLLMRGGENNTTMESMHDENHKKKKISKYLIIVQILRNMLKIKIKS